METIVEAVCYRRGGDYFGLSRGFNSATNQLMFSFNFASDLPRFRRDFCHDRATIRSRSDADRGVGASSITCRSMGDKSASSPLQDLLDRGSIASRSRLDHAAIMEFFHSPSTPSDRASGNWRVTIARSRFNFLVRPMAIQWRWCDAPPPD